MKLLNLTGLIALAAAVPAITAGPAFAADKPAAAQSVPEKLNYNRDIRPILSDNCFHCHGNDKNHIKGKLRLNDREAALKKSAIVPGKPDESEVITRIFSNDPDDIMPPPDAHKVLTPAQKDLLKRWVAEGAEYQPHWAYITPARPELPAVQNAGWAKNPIDRFVLAELEKRKLTPSAEADRRTLIRRLSLDLVGLPPTPAEVEAFVTDQSADAYEKVVDRLLASPHFGERMAAPWLDAVRFSDTVGYHGDQNQNVFPYRDYVINAFNANKPFDQFTREQLAGDLLPKPTEEQLIASGFNRLNMMTREGGAQPKEYIAKYQADRVRTVTMAWLGSTFGCAECHDHKFDPISIKDFYAMSAFFADIRQWGVYHDYNYTPNPDLKGWSNDHPFPPEIKVESPYLKARQAKLLAQLDREMSEAVQRTGNDPKQAKAMREWTDAMTGFLTANPTGWETPEFAGAPAAEGKELPAGYVLLGGATKGKTVAATDLTLKPKTGWVATVRLEASPQLAAAAVSTRQGLKLSATVKPAKGAAKKVGVYYAEADHKEPRYSSTAEQLGVTGGWRLSSAHLKQTQSSYWQLDPPVKLADGDTLVVSVSGDAGTPVRVSVSPLASPTARLDSIEDYRFAFLTAPRARLTAEGAAKVQRAVNTGYLLGTAADADAFKRYKALQRQILDCRDGQAWMQVTVSQKPMTTRVLPRGNWQDETGEVVEPTTPHFLPGLPNAAGRRLNRLDLADWITSADNPLTGRVIVNRFWKQFFGTGLCASIEDVGFQGEWPSHPELLDWLAVEFRAPADKAAKPWDVKRIVRLIVTSNVYRQQSNLPVALRETDPQNRLLSAQSPRRLEAEFIRDNALAAAGLLNLADVGGPSVKPYQPADYYAPLQFPDRPYRSETDERQYRRGVYMHWQRTFLHPMLANFDAPSREDALCTRTVSNTPQQALTLLNDPTFVEASRVLADKLLAAGGTDEQKIDQLFKRVLSREPKPAERQSLLAFVVAQRKLYQAQPAEAEKLLAIGLTPPSAPNPAELAAWTNASRVVLNVHETITRY